MEKKAKITRTVFKSEWAGPNGTVYYHDIELDNGDKGSIGSKEKMPSKLNPGQEFAYIIETDVRGGFKIKAVTTPGGGGFKGGAPRAQVDPRVQMISFAMSYTKDLVVAGKLSINDMRQQFEYIYTTMTAKI